MNKEEAKKRISQALEIKAREDSHIIGSPYVSWVETADKIDAIIDSLTIDHQKVKLPRKVGEELDQFAARYVDVLQFAYHLYALSATEFPALVNWMCSAERRLVIIDAYRYGWEAEPEERFYVQAPKNWQSEEEFPIYIRQGINFMSTTGNIGIATTFTRSELKKYHLDSDIFTLVPVENEEVSR